MFQIYVYYRIKSLNEDGEALGVELNAILVSILSAAAHGVIEIILLLSERKAAKTDILHYLMICYNGRFGWVPYTNLFGSNDSIKKLLENTNEKEKDLSILNY